MRQPIIAQQLDKGLFSPMARSLNNTKHGYTVVRDTTGQVPTEFVERFEVWPGDCGKEPCWSDCENDRERSKLKAIKDRIGTKYWYGWSIYIPEDYVNVSPTSTALAQFHQLKAPGFTPAFMFMNIDRGRWVKRYFGRSTPEHKLIGHNEMVGRWTTMEVHAKLGKRRIFSSVRQWRP